LTGYRFDSSLVKSDSRMRATRRMPMAILTDKMKENI
jgi:hypothetical protein